MRELAQLQLLLTSLLLITFGCRHYAPVDTPTTAVKSLPEKYIEDFSYPQNQHALKKEKITSSRFYKVFAYSFQSSCDLINPKETPHTIFFDTYLPAKPLPHRPTIICLPISGGNYLVSQYFAKFFSKRGYTAVIIKRRRAYKNLITVESINTVIRQMVIDHKQVIDRLSTIQECNINKLAVIGVSKGGLKTAYLSALDNRIKASVITLAGGDIPYILTHSKESGVVKRRNKYLSKSNMTKLDFYDSLKKTLEYEPLELASYVDSNTVMIINAYFDNCVPYQSGKRLAEAHPGCEEVVIATGHYTALLTLPYISEVTLSFFERKLREHPP